MQDDYLPFMFASLIDNFKLTPSQIGQLTRNQIYSLYMFPRDEHGCLIAPVTEQPKEEPELSRLEQLKVWKSYFAEHGGTMAGLDEEIERLSPK